MSVLRKSALAMLLLPGISWSATAASATDDCSVHCEYRTVIVYEKVRKPVVYYVVAYEECGTPYVKKVTSYKWVEIAVPKRILDCH